MDDGLKGHPGTEWKEMERPQRESSIFALSGDSLRGDIGNMQVLRMAIRNMAYKC